MEFRWILAWIGALSLIDFTLAVIDKGQARRGAGRIRERTLLGLALLGGSPGLILAMLLARHKTKKASFLLPLGAILIAQGALVYLLLR